MKHKMKTQKSNLKNVPVIVFLAILTHAATRANCQVTDTTPDSAATIKYQGGKCPAKGHEKLSGKYLYADANLGISNYGMAGNITLNYRWGNRFFSLGHYKSQICYSNDYQGAGLWDGGGCTNHITIGSFSASVGVFLPGKISESISVGISATQFTYVRSAPVRNDFGLSAIWNEVKGSDFNDGVISTRYVNTIGIPVVYKVHIMQRHFIGFDASVRVDLNAERIFTSVTFGIRFGRVVKNTRHS
jgi:hypothetical protein